MMAAEEIIIGIDLGTTFSVVAYVDEYGRPKVIANAEGEKTTPSVVLIDGDQIQVGAVAANQSIVKRDHVIQWVKRAMGEIDYRFQGLNPVEISAEILKKLKADAELELGVPLRKAVITCPAYFSAIEVENTLKAGQLAGLDVQEIVREPTAAAVYYGVEHLHEGGKLLVCDLGGGTYDASVLALENGVFKPLATAGDRQLGGHDWTSDLLDYVADQLTDVFGEDPRNDPATEQTLYDSCERLKRDFARSDQGSVACVHQGQTAQIKVSRGDFEKLTEWRIQQLVSWTEKALSKADPPLDWQDIDILLLVGGATRLRRVAEALAAVSGKQPVQNAEIDTMVALGAAILAKGSYRPRSAAASGIKKNVVSGLTMIQFARTAARNLGTRVILREGNDFQVGNSAIIPYGAELPVEKTRDDYQLSTVGQSCFDIPVVEFDDIGPDVIQETWRFRCPPGLPEGTKVKVTFRYDKSGQIDVEAVEQRNRTVLAKEKIRYEEPVLEGGAVPSSPRVIVFALDVSGSMDSYQKIERAKDAIIDNSRQLLQHGAGLIRIAVVAFGSRAEVICPLTSELSAIDRAVSAVSTYGTTAMGEGINLALNLLAAVDPALLKEIVLVSDGMPDATEEALAAGGRAQAQGVRLWLLNLGHDEVNEDFLRQIASDYLALDSAEGISQAIARLLTQASPARSSGITWLGGKS